MLMKAKQKHGVVKEKHDEMKTQLEQVWYISSAEIYRAREKSNPLRLFSSISVMDALIQYWRLFLECRGLAAYLI